MLDRRPCERGQVVAGGEALAGAQREGDPQLGVDQARGGGEAATPESTPAARASTRARAAAR